MKKTKHLSDHPDTMFLDVILSPSASSPGLCLGQDED